MKKDDDICMSEGMYILNYVPVEEWSDRDKHLIAEEDVYRERIRNRKWWRKTIKIFRRLILGLLHG